MIAEGCGLALSPSDYSVDELVAKLCAPKSLLSATKLNGVREYRSFKHQHAFSGHRLRCAAATVLQTRGPRSE